MMKQSIEWHQECLKNQRLSLNEKRAILSKIENEVDICARKCNLYIAQIRLAEEEKKDGFDRDKYALARLIW